MTHQPDRAARATYRVYDVVVSTDCPLAFPLEPVACGEPALVLERAAAPLLAEDPPEAPLYETAVTTDGGEPLASLYALPDGLLYRVRGVADYAVVRERIRYWRRTEDARLVEYYLLGLILPLWLELRGQPVLHCSAIEAEGGAVAFLAATRTGKSSLAAAFLQAGLRMVTDDVLPLRFEDEAILGVPSFPVLRMWPDQAARLLGDAHELDLVRAGSEKRWLPAEALRGDGFRREPLPLRAAYLLERVEDAAAEGPVRIEALTKTEAVLELLRHSFLGRPVQYAGLAAKRLALFARFADRVPLRRLVYPSGFDALPRVRAAVLEDVRRPAR